MSAHHLGSHYWNEVELAKQERSRLIAAATLAQQVAIAAVECDLGEAYQKTAREEAVRLATAVLYAELMVMALTQGAMSQDAELGR